MSFASPSYGSTVLLGHVACVTARLPNHMHNIPTLWSHSRKNQCRHLKQTNKPKKKKGSAANHNSSQLLFWIKKKKACKEGCKYIWLNLPVLTISRRHGKPDYASLYVPTGGFKLVEWNGTATELSELSEWLLYFLFLMLEEDFGDPWFIGVMEEL